MRVESEKKKSVKVPVADPDSSILPNKSGGFAPNDTTMCVTESQSGMIVDADVLGQDESEPGALLRLNLRVVWRRLATSSIRHAREGGNPAAAYLQHKAGFPPARE